MFSAKYSSSLESKIQVSTSFSLTSADFELLSLSLNWISLSGIISQPLLEFPSTSVSFTLISWSLSLPSRSDTFIWSSSWPSSSDALLSNSSSSSCLLSSTCCDAFPFFPWPFPPFFFFYTNKTRQNMSHYSYARRWLVKGNTSRFRCVKKLINTLQVSHCHQSRLGRPRFPALWMVCLFLH